MQVSSYKLEELMPQVHFNRWDDPGVILYPIHCCKVTDLCLFLIILWGGRFVHLLIRQGHDYPLHLRLVALLTDIPLLCRLESHLRWT